MSQVGHEGRKGRNLPPVLRGALATTPRPDDKIRKENAEKDMRNDAISEGGNRKGLLCLSEGILFLPIVACRAIALATADLPMGKKL